MQKWKNRKLRCPHMLKISAFGLMWRVVLIVYLTKKSQNVLRFVSGLKPDVFREEMYSRSFDTLKDVIREAREELST